MKKLLRFKLSDKWNERLKVWNEKLVIYARASSYAIHR